MESVKFELENIELIRFDPLKFRVSFDEVNTANFSLIADFARKLNWNSIRPVLVFNYDNQHVGQAYFKFSNDKSILFTKLYLQQNYLRIDQLLYSIFACLIAKSREFVSNINIQLLVMPVENFYIEILLNSGFVKVGDVFIYFIDTQLSLKLLSVKNELRKQCRPENKVGMGYLVNIKGLDSEGLNSMAIEYNNIAWGNTCWAKHNNISRDEVDIINKNLNNKMQVLEVGAGSGRITFYLVNKVYHLVATDYSSEIVESLKNIAKSKNLNIVITQDDITQSQFSTASFDCVCFFENGLGNILNVKDRKKAISEMCRIVKVGGVIILGLRNLIDRPADHLMVVPMYNIFMGIYHTFTKEEIRGLIPQNTKINSVYWGEARPAGGHQFFVVLERH
jgi:ubiquinone/menaquinone biosynthesis C-methylase UbiE